MNFLFRCANEIEKFLKKHFIEFEGKNNKVKYPIYGQR